MKNVIFDMDGVIFLSMYVSAVGRIIRKNIN